MKTHKILSFVVPLFTLICGAMPGWGQETKTQIVSPPASSMATASSVEEVCLEFRAQGRRLVEKKTCAVKGRISPWMWIGDDSGYRDQHLRITAWGGAEVCLRYSAVGSGRRTLDQGWACSSNGIPSQELFLGDDSGYKKQELAIRTNATNSVCLDFSNQGRHGVRQSGQDCSSFGRPSRGIWLGDDSGYRNQQLRVSIGGRQGTH